MSKFEKFAKGLGAVARTIVGTTVGFAAEIIEDSTKIDGGNIISDLAYEVKNASYNSARKAMGKETKVYEKATGINSEEKRKNLIRNYERRIREEGEKKGVPPEIIEEKIRSFTEKCNQREAYTTTPTTPRKEKHQPGWADDSLDGYEKISAVADTYNQRIKAFEEKCEKLKATNIPRVSYQEGASWNKTAFVFSCPGQKEMIFGSVCAGTTGVNLSMVLEYCHNKRPDAFPSPNKSDYLITNASDIVHFQSLTNDTEASDEELYAKENLQRLKNELSSKQLIICMGERASSATKRAGISGRVVYFNHHLSNQKLNRAYKNDQFSPDLTPEERRYERIKMVAEDLLSCI